MLLAVRDGDPRGRRALGHELLQRHRRAAGRGRRRGCSPACCATSGGSRASWSPTTGRSRSCADHAPGRRPGRRGGRARAGGGHRRRAAAHAAPTASRSPSWCARARCRRRSSTAPRGGCCARRPSSACSTPAGRPSRPRWPTGALDLDPPEHRALARELAEASVVLLANDGTLPLGAARDRRARRALRRRPARLPRLLLVPQPRRHGGPPGPRARHRGPDAARRPARGAADVTSCTSPAARSRSPTGRSSRRRPTRPARPTSASRWSAIGRACSGAAPRVRAATPRTSRCPGSRTS